MTKKEACHRLADINEKISELEDLLLDVESRLRWDDESRREWYLERKSELLAELERYKQEHDSFISEYGDIIYS
ncbi:MAG: hypothetical protein IJA55_03075 [Clostridia bacterium]|nr:hypothetical protein [Clostridia bacterium]